MPSLPLQIQTLNNQLKMRGKLKAIGGDWFFCCCKKLTAKIGQQRKEESFFCMRSGPRQLIGNCSILSNTHQSTGQLSNFIILLNNEHDNELLASNITN